LEIIDRSKNHGDAGEMMPFNANEKDMREEALKRNAKAGYCTKYGEPVHRTKIMSQGCGENKFNLWPRDEQGNLIGD